jgi:hypothetical protein
VPDRLLIWSGADGWRAEVASVTFTPSGIGAMGTQIGVDPVPYRLDYRLEAPERFVTRWLEVEAAGEGWSRRIDLRHDGSGGWTCDVRSEGHVDLAPAGGPADALSEALDCDLGLSPLTNLMPVRRHSLHERPGTVDLLMAWISVPDLGVHASPQRYEHVRRGVVRYVDRGTHEGFEAELELDADGVVVSYPDLAQRV